ncbi:MAG: methyltransferase domain-containing protein [Gemmatimonadaceae bacterium]
MTPRRRRGVEILDGPEVPPEVRRRSLGDVARSNTLFGGTSAVLSELTPLMREVRGRTVTLLDVGSGLGDIAARSRSIAARSGCGLLTIGLEVSEALALATRTVDLPVLLGDGLALPVRSKGVDIALCSQLLHHFEHEEALLLLRELDRVARLAVIVSDIRRSWIAAAGLWLASFPLRFHPVSRHDGVVSVLRGFTTSDLRELVREALGQTPVVRRRRGFRTTAVWRPMRNRT